MRYYLLIFLVYFSNLVFSQNILKNSEFEDGNFIIFKNICGYDENGNPKYKYGPPDRFLDGINIWETRFSRRCKNKKHTIKWHSPDWYGVINSESYLHSESNYYIHPIEGDKYVGMMDYELIEQKLAQNKRLENNISYILRMKIYLSFAMVGDYSNTTSFSNLYLNIYFAKYEVKYRKETGKYNKVCTDEYKKHETLGGLQDYFDVAYFDLANYQKGQWISLTQSFHTPPSNAEIYKWFVIEVKNKNSTSSCRRAYVLIDDVSVVQGCDNGCSSTDGVYQIYTNGLVTHDHMLLISGLENITQIKFRFKSLNENYATSYFVYNNPANTIGWDGTNTNGASLANANYFMEIEATNDCGTKNIEFYIQKVETYSYYYNYDSMYVDHEPVSKPPEPCCLYNLTLNNQTLVEDKTLNHPLTYKVQNEIQVGPYTTIPPNNNVVMTAGNKIVFLPPFHSQGNLHAYIEPCNSSYTSTSASMGNYIDCDTLTNKIVFLPDSTEKFIVFPNPFDNAINILSSFSNNNFDVEIFNLLGEKLFATHSFKQNIQISTFDLKDGIYLLKIYNYNTGKSSTFKIIKHK